MLRSITSSLLSLVIVAAFLWGGCVSCDEYFMFPGKLQPCCDKAGHCQRPGKSSSKPETQDCNRTPLQRTALAHVPLPAVLPTPIAPAMAQLAGVMSHISPFEVPPDPSPPDFQALHVIFLI